MNLVKCSPAVANTRHDQSGVRRVNIWKGTARERLLVIDRFGVKLPDPLPPEILADAELIVEVVPSDKPVRQQIEVDVMALVDGMPWADLVAAAEQLGVKAHGVKKEKLRAAVIAKIADGEKAEAIEKARAETIAKLEAEAAKKGDCVQIAGSGAGEADDDDLNGDDGGDGNGDESL